MQIDPGVITNISFSDIWHRHKKLLYREGQLYREKVEEETLELIRYVDFLITSSTFWPELTGIEEMAGIPFGLEEV